MPLSNSGPNVVRFGLREGEGERSNVPCPKHLATVLLKTNRTTVLLLGHNARDKMVPLCLELLVFCATGRPP